MEFFISLRYFNGQKRGFISLITTISILGVFLGTAVLLVAISIANGMEKEIRDRILGTFSHARIQKYHSRPIEDWETLRQRVLAHPDVEAASPGIMGKGAVEHAAIQEGVMILGVNDSLEQNVSSISQRVIEGTFSLDSTISTRERKNPGTIIGIQLAQKLGLGINSELIAMTLVSRDGVVDPTPKMMRFTITAVFETGMYEYDQNLMYISLESGQKLFEMDGVEMISFKCYDIYKAGDVAKSIVEDLGGYPYKFSDWESQNQSFFQWMKLEKLIIVIIIMMIVVVAAFNITSTLIMMIMEKRREIGILMSMGATRGNIMRIFLLNGSLIGLIGSTAGTSLACFICWIQATYRIILLPTDVYFINFVPVLMNVSDVLIVFFAANFVCMLAALYPAWQASKLLPAEAIRFE